MTQYQRRQVFDGIVDVLKILYSLPYVFEDEPEDLQCCDFGAVLNPLRYSLGILKHVLKLEDPNIEQMEKEFSYADGMREVHGCAEKVNTMRWYIHINDPNGLDDIVAEMFRDSVNAMWSMTHETDELRKEFGNDYVLLAFDN